MIFEYLLCVSAIARWRSELPLLPLSWTESLGPRAGTRDHETRNLGGMNCDFVEPPTGIEPMTYALLGGLRSSTAVHH